MSYVNGVPVEWSVSFESELQNYFDEVDNEWGEWIEKFDDIDFDSIKLYESDLELDCVA